MDVLQEEITSVLETSVVVPVGTSERTVIVSVSQPVFWVVLVSCSSGVREDVDSVSVSEVLEKPGIDVETVVSHIVEEVTIRDTTLDDSESAEAEEHDLCSELMVPRSVTAVSLER